MRGASLYFRELQGIQRGVEKTDESGLHSSGLPVCLPPCCCLLLHPISVYARVFVCVCFTVHQAWTLSLFPSYPVGNVMPHESHPGLNRPRWEFNSVTMIHAQVCVQQGDISRGESAGIPVHLLQTPGAGGLSRAAFSTPPTPTAVM